jgi:uncharacterized membrane protein
MDSSARIFTKAITWQISGFISMMVIGFLFTGSISASGGIALVGCASGFVAYFIHEIIWAKITWGQRIIPTQLESSSIDS